MAKGGDELNLSKDTLRVLKLANAHESVDFEDACMAVSGSVHAAYAPENYAYLEKNGLVSIHSKMMPEGYKRTTIRITPEGQAVLEAHREQTREKWITRGLSISAIIISAISLIWQILSSATPK